MCKNFIFILQNLGLVNVFHFLLFGKKVTPMEQGLPIPKSLLLGIFAFDCDSKCTRKQGKMLEEMNMKNTY